MQRHLITGIDIGGDSYMVKRHMTAIESGCLRMNLFQLLEKSFMRKVRASDAVLQDIQWRNLRLMSLLFHWLTHGAFTQQVVRLQTLP